MSAETIKEIDSLLEAPVEPGQPGIVLIFSGLTACMVPLPVGRSELELGRDQLRDYAVQDDRVSRRHVTVSRAGDRLRVRDLGSTNGVFLQGNRLLPQAVVEVSPPAVLRIGRTVFLLVADLAPYQEAMLQPMIQGELVVGPRLRVIHQQIAALARGGQVLFLRGESGTGKEIGARLFHQGSPRSKGPLVTVNCATIPKDLAERLLFGTVKGAYSGATSDAEGYLQAAHRGTLFLDEVAELEPGIQAKLLRVLETREVVPLGGTRPHPVDIGLCTATLRDLRDAVASGGFREDLYYRIGRPEVHLPPLRERPEEIPFLVEQAARSSGSKAGAPLVEACLLRPWPGNIRELSTEVRAAAALAVAEGSDLVEPRHLAPQAGQRILSQRPPQGIPAHDAPQGAPSPPPEDLLRAVTETLALARKTALKLLPAGSLAALAKRIEEEKPGEQERAALLRACAAEALLSMLEAQDFNQSAVAVALGTSRTTLIKLMDELALPRATDLPPEQVTAALRESRGDPEAAARLLRVSSSALKKRLSALSMKV